MRLMHVLLVVTLAVSMAPISLAQSTQQAQSVSVPRLVNISGTFRPADGQPHSPVEAITLSIYAEQEGGTPLWQETQSVAIDANGRYSVLLGATHADGIPPEVFAGDAQWFGVVFARSGEVEGPRVRLTSVPYALRSANADTLGGLPASAYLLAPAGSSDSPNATGGTTNSGVITPLGVLPGITNFLSKFVNSVDVGTSGVFENAGMVGVGTTSPLDVMHVRLTNPAGTMTGYAVQNLGATATSYSGMLFYDHTGALGQFQGFNNITKEYRINNIAPNGSINFMLSSQSRFNVANTGRIGLGTTNPGASLHINSRSNLLDDGGATIRGNVAAIKFFDNPAGGGGDVAYIAHVVKFGEATTLELGNLNDTDDDITLRSGAGKVQLIGPNSPGDTGFPNATLSVGSTGVMGQAGGWNPSAGSTFGDGVFIEGSCGTNCEGGGFFAGGDTAAIWSTGDTGAILAVYDEDVLPTTLAGAAFVVNSSGNIRVGYGTNGCVLDADGTQIAGTGCSSDVRLKKDIRPFDGGMLERALKFRPVYYHWRTELMATDAIPPNAGESYGLIAQEVEKLYPEMVSTNKDGYKAVDYTRLPFVLLGALQEEHAKVQSLEARLAKLEAMIDGPSRATGWMPPLGLALVGLGIVGMVFYKRG